MSKWEERKALALNRGTCPYHIKNTFINGRCSSCDAANLLRKETSKKDSICANHPDVKTDLIPCHLCKLNYEKRRDLLLAANKCPKHSVEMQAGNCPECLTKRAETAELALATATCKRHLAIKLIDGKCPACAEYRNTIRNEVLTQNRCPQHHEISILEKPCLRCRAKYTASKENSLQNGVCFYHPNEPSVSGMMCLDCWCASIAGDALGSKKHKNMVKQSFISNSYCFFTGEKLLPGHNADSASFDHIIPLSRGGPKSFENCQWTQLRINVGKNDRTNQEFLLELFTIHEYKNTQRTPLTQLTSEYMSFNEAITQCRRCVESRRSYKRSAPEIRSLCKDHYFKDLSIKHFKTVNHAQELEELFLSQGGLCAYTKTKLSLGSLDKMTQATLDHLIPPKRGGLKDIANVHWVSSRANTLKQNMTHDELLSLAALVFNRFSKKTD